MAFELNSVVPWGRTLKEYQPMFALSDNDLSKRIISFGDGPASFNAEMLRLGKKVTSIDPLYRFSAPDVRKRIDETCLEVIGQMRANASNFIWKGLGCKKAHVFRRTAVHSQQEFYHRHSKSAL
jgi:hypothetical protein